MSKGKSKSKSKATDGKVGQKAAPAPKPGKKPRADRSKRLLDLVMLLLRASQPVTFRDIREQFTSYKTANVEAGLRAFERDKADLLELGVPIRYVTPDEDDGLEEGGYVIELHRYRLPEVELNADEVSALVLAASVARAVPGGSYGDIVDLALQKLAFDAPDTPDTPLDFPPPPSAVSRTEPVVVHFPSEKGRTARELSDRFSSLEAATRNRKRVTLKYKSASQGVTRERQVDPYGLAYRQGTWLVVGYCHLRKDVRSFRIDRILDMKIAPKPKSPDFERPADFDVRSYASRSPWTFASEPGETVELELGPEVASVANEDFGPSARRTELDTGAVRVEFDCTNPDFAVSRVLSGKGSITVRGGKRVRERIDAELLAVRSLYANDGDPGR